MHSQELSVIQELILKDKINLQDIVRSFITSVKTSQINAWETIIRSSDVEISPNKTTALFGLLVGVKDNIATKDFPTSMGVDFWPGSAPGFDARVVHNLRMAGATIVGKTKCSEYAVHEPTDTINPRYPDCEPGTSSSGSAAAVANGDVPVALGTQTAGSIAKPASYCGVIGFKPSFGELPRTGVLKTTELFDTVGMFGNSIKSIEQTYKAVSYTHLTLPTKA